MTLSVAVLLLVTLQRLAELALANHNTRALKARGALEAGAGHYPLIVGLHAAWLGGLWWLAPARPVNLAWLAGFVVLQLLRVWVIASLGRRWTTRIIVLPGEPLVQRGPYRFLKHPNYLIVVAEIATLPLAFGLTSYALLVSTLNAGILSVRLRVESRALRQLRVVGSDPHVSG
jgi:methyltransferase